MMIEKAAKKNCTGCGACAAICPKKAISMQEDSNGFLHPVTDWELCISCGRCRETCHVLHEPGRLLPISVFAAAAKDYVRMRTASGGAFTSLAERFLEHGGVVYGCAMEWDGFSGQHVSLRQIRVTDRKGLSSLSGSKYAQSLMSDTFAQVRSDLQNSRQVLFSGTPCQCSSLRQYLLVEKIPADSLYVADILCHGVPAEKMFRQYVDYLGKKYRGLVTDYQFRDKKRGCKYYPRFRLKKNGKEHWILLATIQEGYWYLFQHALANRESCYSCPYAALERCGDVSLGDYWGIEQAHPELLTSGGGPLEREKGISLLLVNSDKGEQLIRKCGADLICFPSTIEKALARGDALRQPAVMPPARQKVLKLLREKGYAGGASYVRKAMGFRYFSSIMKEKIKLLLAGR